MLRLRLPALHILGRELVEVACRRRTYAMRSLVTLGVLIVFGINAVQLEGRVQGLEAIGHGMDLVIPVLLTVCAGMALLLPITAATSVTREREQGTLVLLMLTPVPTWSLVWQKFLTQLLIAGSLALLTLPLLAVGYALGGMEADLLARIASLIALLAVQLPAIGLAAGCLCRGHIAAILLSYALVTLQILPFFILNVNFGTETPWWLLSSPFMVVVATRPSPPGALLGLAAIPLAFTLLLLLFARLTILRRLAPGGGSPLGRVLRGLDALFARLDARWLRRQVARDLPISNPVLWREASRSSFCNWRYLVRLLLPAFAVMLALEIYFMSNSDLQTAYRVPLLAFLAGSVLIALLGSAVVNRERADQTLDVLLATGMTPASIIMQKARALARVRWAMLAVLFLALGLNWFAWNGPGRDSYHFGRRYWDDSSAWTMVAELAVEMALTYLTCFWLAVRIGLQSRTSVRGMVLSLIAVGLWFSAYPLLLVVKEIAPRSFHLVSDDGWTLLLGVFNAYHVSATLAGSDEYGDGPYLALGWAIDLGCCLCLRWVCLRYARKWLAVPAS